MKLMLLSLFVTSAYSELHSLNITFTGVSGIPALPDYTSLTTVDGIEVNYYDSNIKNLISKQEWMKKPNFTDCLKKMTKNHEDKYNTFLKFVGDVEKQCPRTEEYTDVHTYQKMWSCVWNNVTKQSNCYENYGYDGKDLHSMSCTTIHKLLNCKCDQWLCVFTYGKATFEKTVTPEVSLLQRNSSSPVVCLATGFFPAAVNIIWRKNGQNHHKDVETEDTHPNGDGTFQKRIILRVKTEEWHKNQYSCVVQHKSLSKEIQKILTADVIKTNSKSKKNWSYIWIIIVFVGMLLIGCLICKKNRELARPLPSNGWMPGVQEEGRPEGDRSNLERETRETQGGTDGGRSHDGGWANDSSGAGGGEDQGNVEDPEGQGEAGSFGDRGVVSDQHWRNSGVAGATED